MGQHISQHISDPQVEEQNPSMSSVSGQSYRPYIAHEFQVNPGRPMGPRDIQITN